MADFSLTNKTNIDETYPKGSQSGYVLDDSVRETRLFVKNVLSMISGFPDNLVMYLASWTTDTRPSVSTEGLFGYNSTTDKFERYDGTTFSSLPLDVEEATHADTADLATLATEAVSVQTVGGVNASTVAGYLVPVGGIIFYPSNTIPTGFLLCDGSTVSRTTYAALFAIIGTTFGSGDGTTSFNLPDMRGLFVRGVGGNSAALGVAQGDAIRNITGTAWPFDDLTVAYGSASGAISITAEAGYCAGARNWETATRVSFDASKVVPTAVENRPVNMALNYIIKY